MRRQVWVIFLLLLVACGGRTPATTAPTATPAANLSSTVTVRAEGSPRSAASATPRRVASPGTPATPGTPGSPAVSIASSPSAIATPTLIPTPLPSPAPLPTATATPEPLPTPVPEPTATPIPEPPPAPALPPLAIAPLQARHVEYGFNVFLAGNADGAALNTRTMAKVNEAGFGWVRVQMQWSELEPSPGNYNTTPYDIVIAAAANNGANVLVSIVKAPEWASPSRPGALPENTQAFGRTMRFLAARYQGRVQAWEIWNEQNLAGEVGGLVQIAPYFETLKTGYGAVKSVDPGAFVLFGGLTPTGVLDPTVAIDDTVYLREFYLYRNGEGRNYYDVLAAHPGSAANPPDAKYPEAPGPGLCPPKYASQQGNCWNNAPDFYFRRIEDQRAVMEQYGDGAKQIWLTEFGWDSCLGLPAPNGYEYCSLISEQQQAAYLVRAFQIAQDNWPWMGVMFVWNLNYAATPNIKPDDEKYGWSLLRADWSNRPAFEALKALP